MTKRIRKKCFNCMEPIGRETPIQVFVLANFCHSSYWTPNEEGYVYGKLNEDREDGYLYLHKKCAADSEQYRTYFGDEYEYCDKCGVTFSSDDMNMRDYDETGDVHCPRCQSIEGSVLKPKDFPLPYAKITAHVFSDYDALDEMAKKAGYTATEPLDDEKVFHLELGLRTGWQNDNLHCGWIATMGDSSVSTEDQLTLLNRKVEVIAKGYDFIVGFAQTGNFSVGYSIYVRELKA